MASRCPLTSRSRLHETKCDQGQLLRLVLNQHVSIPEERQPKNGVLVVFTYSIAWLPASGSRSQEGTVQREHKA